MSEEERSILLGKKLLVGPIVFFNIHCYSVQSQKSLRQYIEGVQFIYIGNLTFVTFIRVRFSMRILSMPFRLKFGKERVYGLERDFFTANMR